MNIKYYINNIYTYIIERKLKKRLKTFKNQKILIKILKQWKFLEIIEFFLHTYWKPWQLVL